MLDPGRRKPPVRESRHPPPVEAMPLAALAQVPAPVTDDFRAEAGHDLAVGRYREVREVPADDTAEPSPLLRNGVVSTTFQGHVDGLERRSHSLRVGMAGPQKKAPPGLPAQMGEPHKSERSP